MPSHPSMPIIFHYIIKQLIRRDESNPMPCSFPSSLWDVIIREYDFEATKKALSWDKSRVVGLHTTRQTRNNSNIRYSYDLLTVCQFMQELIPVRVISDTVGRFDCIKIVNKMNSWIVLGGPLRLSPPVVYDCDRRMLDA